MNKNILLIINDNRDASLAKNFYNSLKKFHRDDELEIKIVDREDKEEWKSDPNFYYRAKAIIARDYMNDYDLVMVADADQICFGKLDYKLMGKDHYLYGFELCGGGFGYDSAKFMFRVTQYTATKESKIIFDDAYGLSIGEVRNIPRTDWSIALEKISEDGALFRIHDEKHVQQ